MQLSRGVSSAQFFAKRYALKTGQFICYNVPNEWVDCKSEGNVLRGKKVSEGDDHLCNKQYNSFGHILRKAGYYESNDTIGSN